MAERLEIEVVIGSDGEVKLTTRGLKGQACLEETRALEAALGKVKARTKTSEYYQGTAAAKSGVKGK